MRGVRARRGVVALAMLAAGASVVACRGGEAPPPPTFVALDGSPRRPDGAGVVVDLTEDLSSLTLDGDRRFSVSPALQSFSTLDGSTQALRSWLGAYVHYGADGGTIEWIAGFAAVTRVPGQPPVAYYTGVVATVDGREVAFEDGSVLTLAAAVDPPPAGELVLATIDVDRHEVTELAAG